VRRRAFLVRERAKLMAKVKIIKELGVECKEKVRLFSAC